jgi:hypothetical protein
MRDEGGLVVRDGTAAQVESRVGAQLAIGDLDQDGAADVVTSVDTLGPRFDALEARTLSPTGVERRWRLPVPGGVEALAICPADGPGRAPVVVATAGELWVLR